MATNFIIACGELASCVDNGVSNTDARVAKRVNEAQRRLIYQYNFLIRREELQRTPLTYVATPSDLIFDNIDATKVMILSLWREENNELEMAAVLEKKAIDMVERDILQAVETDRRDEFKALETSGNQNTFGGLVGRIGLETFGKYSSTVSRVASYVNQAHQIAIDHHNFLVRREELNETGASEMTFVAKDIADGTDKAFTFDARVPSEVLRMLSISLMMMDAGVPISESVGMKQQAVALIERNVVAAVEKARRGAFQLLATASNQNTFGGLAGRIGLETVARYRLSPDRIKSYINEALQSAIDHHNFIARRETFDRAALTFTALTANTDVFSNVIPAEVVRLIVLSYIQNDQAATPTSGPLTAMAERQ